MARAVLRLAAVAIFLPSLAFDTEGQTAATSVIRDQPSCQNCNFQLTEVARINIQEGPGFIGIPNSMVRDSRGRVYVTSHLFRGETKVYNADGSYLRTLTKPGGGPGEVSAGANVAVVAGDTVYVFDSGSFRVNVFSPEHHLDRTLSIPLRSFAVTQTGAHLVVAAPKAATGIWTTLHLVTPAGAIIRSFGTPPGKLNNNAEFLLWRYVVASRDSKTVWAAPKFDGYRFERWNLSGKLERVFVREAPWFTPSGPDAVNQFKPGTTPPPALIAAMREDSEGRLWLITGVAKANWKDVVSANPRASQYLTFDAWLEVIDPDRAAVIARQRLPVHGLGFLGADLYTYEEAESGVPIVKIFRVELRQPTTLPRSYKADVRGHTLWW